MYIHSYYLYSCNIPACLVLFVEGCISFIRSSDHGVSAAWYLKGALAAVVYGT